MCGIFSKYVANNENCTKSSHFNEDSNLLNLLRCRGPDAHGSCTISDDKNGYLEFSGHTLWMQGKSPDIQPLENADGLLLFNGDLFNTEWVKDESDTCALLNRLKNDTIDVLKTLNGPFSLIYYEKSSKHLYFCRDRIGRRSLLFYRNSDGFILSSVLSRSYTNCFEISSDCIYRYSVEDRTINEYGWNDSNRFEVKIDDWVYRQSGDVSDFTPSLITDDDTSIINQLECCVDRTSNPMQFLAAASQIPGLSTTIETLTHYLSESVRFRIQTQPKYCSKCIRTRVECEQHSTIGILFSGGLDCTILAVLAHKFVPANESIDLLNVAFNKNDSYDTPDRITSRNSLEELRRLYPDRNWNLIEIDVTMDELYERQREVIADLIFPLQTILDESLGSALWFAARGKSSTSRILLTGIGADELFGGYTRHRKAFKSDSWPGLERELYYDWKRIASRNLARDDRIISHHGRQPRMPYLDEEFVRYSLSLKPWFRCFPDMRLIGSGDKLALRLMAFKLGLTTVCSYPKRAIQFGSRIANKKENAKDISQRLL